MMSPRGLRHAASLHDRHQNVHVLQYDPPTDAIAQLYDPPLYENAHIDIRDQYSSVITQSTIVHGVSQRAPHHIAINATLYERFTRTREIAPGFRIIRML